MESMRLGPYAPSSIQSAVTGPATPPNPTYPTSSGSSNLCVHWRGVRRLQQRPLVPAGACAIPSSTRWAGLNAGLPLRLC